MCTGLAEVVYYMFKKDHEIEKASYEDLIHIGIGIDYGQLNATTFQAFGLNQSKMRVEGLPEYYHSGEKVAIRSRRVNTPKILKNIMKKSNV